jgi:hypothetical protein
MNLTDSNQKEAQMENKYMKKCSVSLTTKEMQIKISLRFCLTPVRMAIIKQPYWWGRVCRNGGGRNPYVLPVEM